VLALARSGATELALQRFERLGLGGSAAAQGHLAIDIPALAARLAKDRALGDPGTGAGPSPAAQPTPMRRYSMQAVIPIQVSMRLHWYFGPVTGKGPPL
jgi:hypothetical protein